MSGDSKSESAAKVEEKVRVEYRAPHTYVAQLWVGVRYFGAPGQTEDEARNALPRVIYEAHAQGEAVDPNDLPVAVRKGVLEYGRKMADLARSELLKKTAAYLHFAPHIGYRLGPGDPSTYVCSPLEVAANCIHRGADLADTDPAWMPEVLTWFYAEISALEHSADGAKQKGFTEGAAKMQAKAEALKTQLSRNGFKWAEDLGWTVINHNR